MTNHLRKLIDDCEGFEWDEGNQEKIWTAHQVHAKETEEVFFDKQLAIHDDPKHSIAEDRFIAIGKTEQKRLLFVVFTIRNKKIRVISARDVTKSKEVELYEKAA